MNLGLRNIDEVMAFPAVTASLTAGAVDADSVPTYRVYEDETGTAILTGSMAKLDDANTIGFYSEAITLSAANGFELGKSYTIYIQAVIGGVTVQENHTFQVSDITVKIDNLATSVNSGFAAAASTMTTVNNKLDTIDNIIDDEIPAIKAKTDLLPADPADASDVATAITAAQTAVLAKLPAALVGGRMDSSVGSNLDKTDYGLSAAAVQAIWDALTSALTTVGSIGKWLVDKITGDAFGRLGAPAGASIAADIATGRTENTDEFAAVNVKLDAISAAAMSAAGIRAAIGMATNNLDTQLTALAAFVDTEIAAIKAKTDLIPTDPADQSALEAAISAAQVAILAKLPASLSAGGFLKASLESIALTCAVPEGYSALNATPMLHELLHEMRQGLLEYAIVNGVLTIFKMDGTAAIVVQLNHAVNPTARERTA